MENTMADLIAIGYDDETTAASAAAEVDQLARDLIIEPDAVAVIVRDKDGKYKVTTSHHPVGAGASYGMFWGLLFGVLFFVPVFGMAVGAGLRAPVGEGGERGLGKGLPGQGRGKGPPGPPAPVLLLGEGAPG